MEEQLTPEEMKMLEEAMKGGAPLPDEKHNAHTFLNTISKSSDTTKTGNLEMPELGTTPYSLRTYKNIRLIAEKLVEDDMWTDYFAKKGEILTATSLSKGGFLTGLAVVQKRQIEDITQQQPRENKGWFKRRDDNVNNTVGGVN